MAIGDHVATFAGRPVVDFTSTEGRESPKKYVHRLRRDWDDERTVPDQIAEYTRQPWAGSVSALVIGIWEPEDIDIDSNAIVAALVEAAPRLPALRHIFLGDIVYEECEMSWITQGDVGPLLAAYPRLETFRVRGTNGLSFGSHLAHPALKTLIIESGGLPADLLTVFESAHLPELEHLELWLGSQYYGGISEAGPLTRLLHTERFPKLKYLGLRNSRIADQVAEAAAQAPILAQIHTLDLSLGTLGDEGGAALADSPRVSYLMKLDVHRHYMSDAMVARLQGLGIEVDVGEAQGYQEDVENRYNVVSE